MRRRVAASVTNRIARIATVQMQAHGPVASSAGAFLGNSRGQIKVPPDEAGAAISATTLGMGRETGGLASMSGDRNPPRPARDGTGTTTEQEHEARERALRLEALGAVVGRF